MGYKYSESEKFRANMFFISGLAFCTPLGVNVINVCQIFRIESFIGFLISLALFLVGFYLIGKSYDIILKKDMKNE